MKGWALGAMGCMVLSLACQTATGRERSLAAGEKKKREFPVKKSDEEWRKILTEEQYHILREKGTERAFTGAYWASKDKATYLCAACGQELFRSSEKFDSGTGWPSFWAPARGENVQTERDGSHGMVLTEVVCSRCGGHLGHVFPDGPKPTGLRYCINSAALKAVKSE
jgi:peptide-methionine (R)-S-oxide reductase